MFIAGQGSIDSKLIGVRVGFYESAFVECKKELLFRYFWNVLFQVYVRTWFLFPLALVKDLSKAAFVWAADTIALACI